MTAMAHSPEGQEFRKIARNQGLQSSHPLEGAALQIVDLVNDWGRTVGAAVGAVCNYVRCSGKSGHRFSEEIPGTASKIRTQAVRAS